MDQVIKEKWLKALRSGDYAQGTNKLTWVPSWDNDHTEQYCCLGVLCKLAVDEGILRRKVADSRTYYSYIDPDNPSDVGQRNYLHRKVLDWADLPVNNPYVGGDTLGSLNDKGRTFEEIANLIEEHL